MEDPEESAPTASPRRLGVNAPQESFVLAQVWTGASFILMCCEAAIVDGC